MEFTFANGNRMVIGIDWTSLCLAITISLVSFSILFFQRIKHFINKKKLEGVNMVRVIIPFTVGLEMEKYVVAVVNSSVKCCVEVHWCVDIKAFQKEMETNWSDDVLLKNVKKAATIRSVFDKGEKRFILNRRKFIYDNNLRTEYPVAIIVRNLNKSLGAREGKALITTVHIGDHASSARIISQSLKLASGQVTLLQRLFPSGLYDEASIDLCVVCFENPVTRVVLPCKHACLCANCFQQIIICPMCRANIQSFFCISTENEGRNKVCWTSKFGSYVKSVWMRS